jgi:hypothetical protein
MRADPGRPWRASPSSRYSGPLSATSRSQDQHAPANAQPPQCCTCAARTRGIPAAMNSSTSAGHRLVPVGEPHGQLRLVRREQRSPPHVERDTAAMGGFRTLNSAGSSRAIEPCVRQQQLHGPEVTRAAIHQRHLRPLSAARQLGRTVGPGGTPPSLWTVPTLIQIKDTSAKACWGSDKGWFAGRSSGAPSQRMFANALGSTCLGVKRSRTMAK